MEDKILFKVKFNLDDLETKYPSGIPSAGIYNSELIIDLASDSMVILKIFFNPEERLGMRLMRWIENNNDFFKYFDIVEINNPKHLESINLKEFEFLSIENRASFVDSGLEYMLIKISGIKLIYNINIENDNVFYLNKSSFNLVEMNYFYDINLLKKPKEFKYVPINKYPPIKFGDVYFQADHDFYISDMNDRMNINIKKEPRIRIIKNQLENVEIKKHIDLICSLYSFYSHSNVDYYLAKINCERKAYIEIKNVDNELNPETHGIFRYDFSQNPLNLISNVNSFHMLQNDIFIKKLISRFNYALRTDGESKFMILYNILEQIRNEYILRGKIEVDKNGNSTNIKKVYEKYSFNQSQKKTDSFIKDALMTITSIVSEEHKDMFNSEIQYKIGHIKLISMTNQFKSFFDFIKIKPETFSLDFVKLKSLRDDIFHGRPISENQTILESVNDNRNLPRFVGIIMLKYLGIEDISKIDKVKQQT